MKVWNCVARRASYGSAYVHDYVCQHDSEDAACVHADEPAMAPENAGNYVLPVEASA